MHPASNTLPPVFSKRRGFSLIEVVVAVGIFAIAIVSVIGLLGPINKTVSDVRDFDDASRVVAALQGALKESYTFDQLGDALPGNGDPSTALYADRTGQRIGPVDGAVWDTDSAGNPITGAAAVKDAQKFFQVYLSRNTTLSPPANDDTAGFLAFTITLRWPAYLPNGQAVGDASQQSVMVIPAAITR